MRLKSVYISHYKNLNDFTLNFDGNSFIDVFVGKNGTGKSNLFEALIKIFRHLDEDLEISFDYKIKYEIEGRAVTIEWRSGKRTFNGKTQRSLDRTAFPDNILIYYSGHNETVSALVHEYEKNFRGKIKGANIRDSRFFIGVDAAYKNLLLANLLIQPESSKAREYIRKKLGISSVGSNIDFVLQRPSFANSRLRKLGFGSIDHFDPASHYWGADGVTREFLDKTLTCIKMEFNHADIYFPNIDEYRFSVNIELFQNKFGLDQDNAELRGNVFRMLDNLKMLGMLAEISIPLKLSNDEPATIAQFSDGQFQSVYIYSIVELFKDRNCITLLDEPDCFLHPEWQFEFLKQVFDITDITANKNHVLMTSHSASTITTANDSVINLFEFDGSTVAVTKVKKADVIKSLSAGLIAFSESEARLNINHILKNTTGAVLFTEGITDEMILETAWSKLYPTEEKNFDIQNAFSCGFLRNLMKDRTLYQNHPGRTFFALFDFDEAYNDWNQLGLDVQTVPCQCLAKKHTDYESYALLLPVPASGQIHQQVINPHTCGTYGNRSLLTTELLFYGVEGLDDYFAVDTERTDGFIKFISDSQKVTFARDVVPTIDTRHFGVFRPIFEFIRSKCQV